MKIIIAVALIVFLVYETIGLFRDIPKWRSERLRKKQELEQNKKSDTSEVVGDSDSK